MFDWVKKIFILHKFLQKVYVAMYDYEAADSDEVNPFFLD